MGMAQRAWPGLIGLAIAAMLPAALHDFTVDDALISARYATHIAIGAGHRFNVDGPLSDGVTPLPWPYLLAPFAKSGPLSALQAGKVIGLVAWLFAAIVLSKRLHAIAAESVSSRKKRWSAYLGFIVAFGTPGVGGWAVSGMETGLAMAAVTIAAVVGERAERRWLAVGLLGLSTTLRPELLPYALTLSLGSAWMSVPNRAGENTPALARAIVRFGATAALPFIVVTAIRWIAFGSPAPLALRAKPSDLEHGAIYALASCLVAGPPLAILDPFALRKLPPWPRWLVAAFVVHIVTLVGVGGDWMPMSRLFVPVLPSLAIVFTHLALLATKWSNIPRMVTCLAGQMYVLATVGPAAARVGDDRHRLVQALRSELDPQDVVAAVDIGWVGAAHSGTIVDLGGVTDAEVAALPGGHTSKRISEGFFDSREVSHLVLLLPQIATGRSARESWEACLLARQVERQACGMERVHRRFDVEAEAHATPTLRYALIARKASPSEP